MNQFLESRFWLVRKGKEKREGKKNIFEEPLYANYFAGCLFYLSHISLKVALVNMHKFLNWSIFCPSLLLFFFAPVSLILSASVSWPLGCIGQAPISGPDQPVGDSGTRSQGWGRERERERPRCFLLLILSIFPSYVSASSCFFIINLLIFDSNYCPHYFDKHQS